MNKKCHHLFANYNIKDKRILGIFKGMKQRCYNESDDSYRFYGARGIGICDSWLQTPSKFEEWSLENGYEAHLTIDRIDSDKWYEPNNCRWVTLEDNARYKSSTRIFNVGEESHTGREWSFKFGLSNTVINGYLRNYPEEVVKEFLEFCEENGLPQRNGRNQSYINAYLTDRQ